MFDKKLYLNELISVSSNDQCMYENKGRNTNNLKSCRDQACCYTYVRLVTFLSNKSIYKIVRLQDYYANVQHNRVTCKKCADQNTLILKETEIKCHTQHICVSVNICVYLLNMYHKNVYAYAYA